MASFRAVSVCASSIANIYFVTSLISLNCAKIEPCCKSIILFHIVEEVLSNIKLRDITAHSVGMVEFASVKHKVLCFYILLFFTTMVKDRQFSEWDLMKFC